MEGTVFMPSLEGMKNVKSEQGKMLTRPFLDVCKLILPVVDKFGAAMTLVKSDIGGNITRLESKYNSDPSKYERLYSMVQVEVESKTAKGSSSCTNGLLWLTRAMDFLVELFRNLIEHPDWAMSKACTDSYGKTLKKWHGWLASESAQHALKQKKNLKSHLLCKGDSASSYSQGPTWSSSPGMRSMSKAKKDPAQFHLACAPCGVILAVAMKLAPDRKKFMDVIGGSGDINADIEKFCTTFAPLLQENHKFLASVGLDDLKAS